MKKCMSFQTCTFPVELWNYEYITVMLFILGALQPCLLTNMIPLIYKTYRIYQIKRNKSVNLPGNQTFISSRYRLTRCHQASSIPSILLRNQFDTMIRMNHAYTAAQPKGCLISEMDAKRSTSKTKALQP